MIGCTLKSSARSRLLRQLLRAPAFSSYRGYGSDTGRVAGANAKASPKSGLSVGTWFLPKFH